MKWALLITNFLLSAQAFASSVFYSSSSLSEPASTRNVSLAGATIALPAAGFDSVETPASLAFGSRDLNLGLLMSSAQMRAQTPQRIAELPEMRRSLSLRSRIWDFLTLGVQLSQDVQQFNLRDEDTLLQSLQMERQSLPVALGFRLFDQLALGARVEGNQLSLKKFSSTHTQVREASATYYRYLLSVFFAANENFNVAASYSPAAHFKTNPLSEDFYIPSETNFGASWIVATPQTSHDSVLFFSEAALSAQLQILQFNDVTGTSALVSPSASLTTVDNTALSMRSFDELNPAGTLAHLTRYVPRAGVEVRLLSSQILDVVARGGFAYLPPEAESERPQHQLSAGVQLVSWLFNVEGGVQRSDARTNLSLSAGLAFHQ